MEAQEAQVAQRDRELVEALLSAGTYDLTEEPETPDEDPGDQRTRELAWRNAHNAFLREVRRLRAENATLTADNWRLRARKAAARTSRCGWAPSPPRSPTPTSRAACAIR